MLETVRPYPSDRPYDRTSASVSAAEDRGSNQTGMRAHNERLVLGLVRKHGALAKVDIARITGLSAQTTSVIMRALEQDGLLLRGARVKGKVGQPSVPMSLAPDGAFFLGLKIGRRSSEIMLVDFLGNVRAIERRSHPYPTPEATLEFVTAALPLLTGSIPAALRWRITGMGVAMPFQLWHWARDMGAPSDAMDAWRQCDVAAELSKATGFAVSVQNDATSACGAELVFAPGAKPRDFLYFYFGSFIGGGLVLNGQLYLGRTGNAAGVGTMPLSGEFNAFDRLLDRASLVTLHRKLAEQRLDGNHLWAQPDNWTIPEPILSHWVRQAAEGLALATLSAAALLELEAVMIDGWLPSGLRKRIVQETELALQRLDLSGITPISVREGRIGPLARSLGAAAIPLSSRFLIDHNVPWQATHDISS